MCTQKALVLLRGGAVPLVDRRQRVGWAFSFLEKKDWGRLVNSRYWEVDRGEQESIQFQTIMFTILSIEGWHQWEAKPGAWWTKASTAAKTLGRGKGGSEDEGEW